MSLTQMNDIFLEMSKYTKKCVKMDFYAEEEPAGLCESRFGGSPDVPREFEWPYYTVKDSISKEEKTCPLAFLMQIDLGEVSDSTGLLPENGMLLFFYEMESQKWGYDPEDKGCARVYWFPKEDIADTAEFPDDLSKDFIFPEQKIQFNVQESIISVAEFLETPESAALSEKYPTYNEIIDSDEFNDFIDDKTDTLLPFESSTLLGYPHIIQNPMQEECEAVSRGIYMGDTEYYNGGKCSADEKAEILENSKEWILLMQLDSVLNDDIDLCFGDCGKIYFWIKKQDLKDKNFDNTWLILECY